MSKKALAWTQRILWSRWNQRMAKQSLSSVSFGCGAAVTEQGRHHHATHLLIRNHSSMLPPTPGLFQSVAKYLFESSGADENNVPANDTRELMDELLDDNISVGEMNSSHLEKAKRAITLLKDMDQTTKQDMNKAWNLLDRLVEELKCPSSSLHMSFPPDDQTALLNDILTTWRQSIGTKFYRRVEKRNGIEESKYILSRFDSDGPFFQPNTESYNEVLHGLNRLAKVGLSANNSTGKATRPQVAQLIETIVKRMSTKAQRNPSVKPDIESFNSVINSFVSSGLPDAYDKAEAVLDQIRREGLKPNTASYNAALGVLVREKDRVGDEAEAFLYRMQQEHDAGNENVKPDATSFSCVIEAWARQQDSASAQRADDIFEHMHRQYGEGVTDVKPNLDCYKWAILAWTRSRDPSATAKAEAILRCAQQRKIEGAYLLLYPVIGAFSKSKHPNAAVKADVLLQELQSVAVKPSKDVYICVLKMWKKTKHPEAKARMERLTKDMEQRGHRI